MQAGALVPQVRAGRWDSNPGYFGVFLRISGMGAKMCPNWLHH
jgi:hypothetical protein